MLSPPPPPPTIRVPFIVELLACICLRLCWVGCVGHLHHERAVCETALGQPEKPLVPRKSKVVHRKNITNTSNVIVRCVSLLCGGFRRHWVYARRSTIYKKNYILYTTSQRERHTANRPWSTVSTVCERSPFPHATLLLPPPRQQPQHMRTESDRYERDASHTRAAHAIFYYITCWPRERSRLFNLIHVRCAARDLLVFGCMCTWMFCLQQFNMCLWRYRYIISCSMCGPCFMLALSCRSCLIIIISSTTTTTHTHSQSHEFLTQNYPICTRKPRTHHTRIVSDSLTQYRALLICGSIMIITTEIQFNN